MNFLLEFFERARKVLLGVDVTKENKEEAQCLLQEEEVDIYLPEVKERNGLFVDMQRETARKCFHLQEREKQISMIYENLFICGSKVLEDEKIVNDLRITRFINLCPTEVELPNFVKQKPVLDVKVADSVMQESIFEDILNVLDFIEERARTLIFCFHGVSRSATFAIACVMKREGTSFREAFKKVKAVHRAANPNPNFISQLIDFQYFLRSKGNESNFHVTLSTEGKFLLQRFQSSTQGQTPRIEITLSGTFKPYVVSVLAEPCEEAQVFVGEEAIRKKGILSLKYPVQQGLVTDWEAMHNIWHHSFFNVLKVEPRDHFLLLIQKPLSVKAQIEKLVKKITADFKVKDLLIAEAPILALRAQDLETGIVLDVGHSVTVAYPIYKGFLVFSALQTENVGGEDLSWMLYKNLIEEGYYFHTLDETIIHIKHTVCRIFPERLISARNEEKFPQIPYELPDGQVIKLYKSAYETAEIFFDGEIFHGSSLGLQGMVLEATQQGDEEISRELIRHVVLSGMTTSMQGFAERLSNELATNTPDDIEVSIYQEDAMCPSIWQGALRLVNSEDFKGLAYNSEEGL
eukprot:maker-scaffold_39-augustus-gene-0.41-mRNA-1 protein AED:0.35 eAED:0.35 QI:0/0/0/1/1/1/2/0/576